MLSFIALVFQRIKSSKFTPHNLINSPESIDIANHFERIEKNMGILSEIMILGLKMGIFFLMGFLIGYIVGVYYGTEDYETVVPKMA